MFVKMLVTTGALAALMSGAGFTGTWKLNTSKSKFTGAPMPQELTVTYTPQGAGYTYQAKGTAADGTAIDSGFTYTKDGEDIKMTGYPYADALVLKNGNSDSSSGIFKRGGKNVGTAKRVISADGKTMTITADLTLADGKKANYVAVYDKR